MAIMKSNNFRVSKFGSDCSPLNRDCVFSDDEEEDEINICGTASESDTDSDSERDVDSGGGSDDFDLSELGEVGAEFCQLGTYNFSAPFDLYNLPDLCEILSLDSWNNCLTEDERFSLAEYLPDMDQGTFVRTLKELFSGENFHFGSPLTELFNRLKGGLCEPRVALYQQGLNFLEKRNHYHSLRKYQDSMVSNLLQMKGVWDSYPGYGIEKRLQILAEMKSQKSLPLIEAHGSETDLPMKEELGNGLMSKNKDLLMSTKRVNHGLYASKPPTGLDPVRYRETYPKGVLKVAKQGDYSKKFAYAVQKEKFRIPDSEYAYDVGKVPQFSHHVNGNVEEDARQTYGTRATKRNRHSVDVLKPGKKHRIAEDYLDHTYSAMNNYFYSIDNSLNGKQRTLTDGGGYDFVHGEGSRKFEQIEYLKHKKDKRSKSTKVKGNCVTKPSQRGYLQVDDLSGNPYDSAVGNRKWKSVDDFNPNMSMMTSDPRSKVYESFSSHLGNSYFPSGQKAKKSREKVTRIPSQNGGQYGEPFGLNPSEYAEFDSSRQVNDHVEFNATSKKSRSKLERDLKNNKLQRKDSNEYVEMMQDLPEVETFTSKGKQKGRTSESHYILNDDLDDSFFHPSVDLQVDSSGLQNVGDVTEGHDEYPGRPSQVLAKPSSNKKRKVKVEVGCSSPHSIFVSVDNMEPMDNFVDEPVYTKRPGKKTKIAETYIDEFDEREDASASLLACNSVPRKRKVKKDPGFVNLDEFNFSQSKLQSAQKDNGSAKKKGKKKGDNESLSMTSLALDVNAPEMPLEDIVKETKPQKKIYIPITPTVHTGFSFSVVHLLSAVRIAMTASTSADIVEKVELEPKPEKGFFDGFVPPDNHVQATADTAEQSEVSRWAPLTIQEIVNRVKSNPCDPCILETQEPLLDLVRGVLRIFCSKTAPLGAKGWKALVTYEKVTKHWTWVGPVLSPSPGADPVEETSPDAWGVPHKMLVKLVDAFANWLKNGQETLQLIGSLPEPPLMFMPHVEDKERFRDLRTQKSLTTISPSAEQVKEYFRKEEYLRYLVPDRAFCYTAIDGKKSIVAPLRRCGGKPTSKARDHFMLKSDRPPHVTILCLVRDAASRLPGSIGTRADVCTLIRDSQYVMEDVSDEQINGVVSGALDRLHYERDPCVQFDSERKVWVYLHRDREEEDFADDGTSSTKKWKRPRKEPADQIESGPVLDLAVQEADLLSLGPCGDFDLGPDLLSDPSLFDQDKAELVYHNMQSSMASMEPFIDSSTGGIRQSHPMGWEVLETNHLTESNLLGHDNLTNHDYNDDDFGGMNLLKH